MESSDLLSEGTQSDGEGVGVGIGISGKKPFSFHQYLDEVAGSDVGSDDSDGDGDGDVLMPTESGLSYDNENDNSLSMEDAEEQEQVEAIVDVDVDIGMRRSAENKCINTVPERDRFDIVEALSMEEVEIVRNKTDEDDIAANDSGNDNDKSVSAYAYSRPESASGKISANYPNDNKDAEIETDMDVQMTDYKLPVPSSPPPKILPSLSKEEIEIINVNQNQNLNTDEPKSMETDSTVTVTDTVINTAGTISGINMYSPPRVYSTSAVAAANINSPASTLSQKTATPPSSIKRVRMSPFAKTTPSKRAMATPPRRSNNNNNKQSQQSPSRESQSKRPKIISPFSPRARKMRMKQPSTVAGQQVEFSSQVKWSMAPSRKVSILVNVSPHIDATVSNNDEENTLCLYPNVAFDEQGQGGISGNASLGYNSPARSIRSSYSVTSQSSILNKAGPGQELILVNPSAFGDMIPTSITVETARVVQQFSHIASEDWVRKFKFDEVCWPDVKQLVGIKKQNTNATMDDISRATVADVINGKSAVLFGYGVHLSGRLESMFGSIAGKGIDPLSTIGGRKSIGLELGLLGLIVSKLLDKQKIEMKQMTFKVSIVEILDEDVIRDLLQKPPSSASRVVEKSIRIRHPDNKGAIIENAIELQIKTLAEVKKAVKRAFHSKYNIRERKMVGGRGHIVATVHVFPDGEKIPQKGGRKNYSYPLIQLVDLACAESEQMEQEKASGRSKIQMTRVQNRRLGCIRQSMAGLGAILRRMVAAEVLNLPQSSMYRACTLTKLVQRALDNGKSRGIMISTVCPRKESYKQTLHALTFMHRLLVKPTTTAESPFENKVDEFDGHSFGGHLFFSPGDQSIAHSVAHSVASSVASEAIRSEFVHAKGTRAFMKSLTTDPRQRLATLMSPKESPSFVGSHAGLPMTEITTINELDNDAGDDVDAKLSESIQDSTSAHPDFESLDSSVVEKEADLSHGRLSALSDELTFGGSRDGTFDNSLHSEPESATEKPTTFDKVLDQLDEIDAYSEDDDSDYLVSEEGSVESLQPIDTSNTSDVDEEKDKAVDVLQKGKEPEGEIYEPQPVPYSRPAEPLVNTSVLDQESQKDQSVLDTEDPIETEVPPRPDPSGQIADELPDQSTSRVYQARQTPIQPTVGEDRSGGGGHSEEESYGRFPDDDEFTQSQVSTLTPYDIMTRDDESESHRSEDDDNSMSSEESFPRNSSRGDDGDDESFPRCDDNDVASDASFQRGNDEASSEIERETNIDMPRGGSEEIPLNKSETGALLPEDRSRSSSTSSRSKEHVGDTIGARYEYPPDDLLPSDADVSSLNDFGEGCLQDEKEINDSRVSASRGRVSVTESSRARIDPDAFYEADVYEQKVSVRELHNQSPARLPKNDIISESTSIKNQSRQTASAILSDYLFDDSPDSSQDEDTKSPPSWTREDVDSPIRASDRTTVRAYEEGPQKVDIATDARLFEDSDQYADNIDVGDNRRKQPSVSMRDNRHGATTEPPFRDESYPGVNVGTGAVDLDTKEQSGRIPVNTGLESSLSVDPIVVLRNVNENEPTGSFPANQPGNSQLRNDDSSSPCDDDINQSAFREIATETSRKTQNTDSVLPFKGARVQSTTHGIAQPSAIIKSNQTPQGNERDEELLCESDGSQSTGPSEDQDKIILITRQENRIETETRNRGLREDRSSVGQNIGAASPVQPYRGQSSMRYVSPVEAAKGSDHMLSPQDEGNAASFDRPGPVISSSVQTDGDAADVGRVSELGGRGGDVFDMGSSNPVEGGGGGTRDHMLSPQDEGNAASFDRPGPVTSSSVQTDGDAADVGRVSELGGRGRDTASDARPDLASRSEQILDVGTSGLRYDNPVEGGGTPDQMILPQDERNTTSVQTDGDAADIGRVSELGARGGDIFDAGSSVMRNESPVEAQGASDQMLSLQNDSIAPSILIPGSFTSLSNETDRGAAYAGRESELGAQGGETTSDDRPILVSRSGPILDGGSSAMGYERAVEAHGASDHILSPSDERTTVSVHSPGPVTSFSSRTDRDTGGIGRQLEARGGDTGSDDGPGLGPDSARHGKDEVYASYKDLHEGDTSANLPCEQTRVITDSFQSDRDGGNMSHDHQFPQLCEESQLSHDIERSTLPFPSANQPYNVGAYPSHNDADETELEYEKLPEVDRLNDQDSSKLSADLSASTPVDHMDDFDHLSEGPSGNDSLSSNISSEVGSVSQHHELLEQAKRVPVTESLVSSVANLSEQVEDQLNEFDEQILTDPTGDRERGDTQECVSKTKVTKREVYLESPSRTVKKSVVHTAKSLVSRSDALRAYSPDGKIDPRKSLETYKTMLMESLKALDGEMEGSSIGGLSSDGDDYDERETSFGSAVSSKFKSYSAGITTQDDLAYPASDESSNDGDSLTFDPVPSEEFQSDIDNISSQKRSTHERPSRTEISPTIRSEIKILQESLKQCVDSTNESELITELAEDNFDIAETFNSDEEPIVGTIKRLTSQTEALQSFINSTMDQLQESRSAERSKQEEVAETNLRLEETLDEIQSLRSSNRVSIDQIKQDHEDALNEAKEKEIKQSSDMKASVESAAREEMESNLRSSLASEQEEKELLKSSISALKQEIEDMENYRVSSSEEHQRLVQLHSNEVSSLVEALDKNDVEKESQSSQLRNLVQELQTQLQDQKSGRHRLESSLESEKAISTNVTERLDSERKTQVALKDEIKTLESRLADEIIANKDASLNLKGRYEENNRTLKHTLEEQTKTLQKRLDAEERQKDDLEDRLTDEVNSLQHILESKTKQNADLKDSMISLRSEFEERMKCEGGDKQTLHSDINILRERVANELAAKHELEASLLSEISKVKSSLDGNVKSNKRLQNEMEERLKSERSERSALGDKILSLHESLERERREKKETVARFTTDLLILEGDLNSRNNACAKLEEVLKSMRSEHNKRLESERNKTNKLSEKVDELEESLKISEAQGHLSIENSKMRIAELQDDLIENNMMNSELKDLLEDTRSQYEEESDLRTNLDQKVQDLEERLSHETLDKDEIQAELMQKVNALEESLKIKEEDELFMKNEYGDRLKLEGIEKASLEDEIHTLQERLQEEAQDRDDIEAQLTNKVVRMKDDLATNKRCTDDLSNDLEEARQGLESTMQLLDSEKNTTTSLEQNNVLLREQIDEDSKVIGQLKESLSDHQLVQEEELEKKSQVIKELSNQLSDFEQKLAELNSRLTSERNEKNSLASVLSAMQLHLDKELKGRQEQEDLLKQSIDALKNEMKENLKENSTLSQEVESLKKKHDHLQGKLVNDFTERMQEKASSDTQISSLEIELNDRADQLDDLNETLDRMRGENERLKDHLEVEIGKLTSELTERMKEKAKYEAAAATLEAMLEESNQERDTLRDDLSTKRQIFVELEDRMNAEVEERSRQEDTYLSRIEYLENALNDCCKSKEELNEIIRILEVEKESLNSQVASLTSERDAVQQQVNDNKEEREALEQEISDTTTILDEVKSELRSALESVEYLELEKEVTAGNVSKNAAKWENRLSELSTELAKETTSRLQEETDHSGKITAMTSEAEKQRQSLLNQVSNAEGKYSMFQDKMKSELEREQSIHANDEAMIAALNSKLDEKDRIAREMETKLEDAVQDLLSLNERLTGMSEEHSEATRLHTEVSNSLSRTIQEKDEDIRAQAEEFNAELDEKDRIAREMETKLEDAVRDLLSLNERQTGMSEEHSEATRLHTEVSNSLSRTIQEKDETLRAQVEDNVGLQEEINRLYHTLKEEIESHVKSEKSYSANVSKLQNIVSTSTIEIEEITSQLSKQKVVTEKATHKLAKEMDDKTNLERNLLISQHDVNSLRSQTSDLQGTIQTLQDELERSRKDANSQQEQTNHIQSEFADSKRTYEREKRSFHDAFKTKQKELKTLSKSVQVMEKTVEDKDGFINDLKNTVDELKVSLESEMTKVYSLSMTKDTNVETLNRLAQDISSLKDQMAQERTSQSSELEKLKTHLDSKVSENTELKENVESARQDNAELRRTMEEALEESNYIQQEFTETLQRAKEDLKARILELEDDKRSRGTATKKRVEELSTRISDLSIMKETLQSENVSLMEKVQEEKQSREKILKKNKQLKTALCDNETKVRNEMNELEFTMNSSITKIESKRKKAIEEEKAKMSLALDKLEDENDSYRIKITQLESAVRRLERQSSMGIRGRANNDSQEEADKLRNENERLMRRIRILETTESSKSFSNTEEQRTYRGTPGRGDKRRGTPGSPGGDGNGNDYYIVEYRLERERRIKAEEFAAAMAARAKAGFEDRNEEIVGLRMKMSSLESEKENFDHQRQLMLTGTASSQNPTDLLLALQERNEALEEAQRYKSIANQLNEKVVMMNGMIGADENDDNDAAVAVNTSADSHSF